MGIVVDAEDTKKRTGKIEKGAPPVTEGAKLSPLMFAAQLNDLVSTSDELAEIGIQVDDANRMDNMESQGESAAARDTDSGKGAKKKPTKTGKVAEPAPNVGLLKERAKAAFKTAELKWGLALHKAETIFNKSNRIIGLLIDSRNRWPNDVKLTGIELAGANTLSHLFNPQFGINEKAPQLAEWLSTNSILPGSRQSAGQITPQKSSLGKL
jgi:hypothetical protein